MTEQLHPSYVTFYNLFSKENTYLAASGLSYSK